MNTTASLSIASVTFAMGLLFAFFFQNVGLACFAFVFGIVLEIYVAVKT